MKITIDSIPPSDNKYKGRHNVWEYRADKKKWLDMVMYQCKDKTLKKPIRRAKVTITYYFKTRGRRDPDNYSGKFILDGLVQAGMIEDDSFKCIDLRLKGGYDKRHPRTEIIIEDMEGEQCHNQNGPMKQS